jgi:hypothetical protein
VTDYAFPEQRFKEAGATASERDQLRREFNMSDVVVQRSLNDHWAPLSKNGLRDYLQLLRDNGHFREDEGGTKVPRTPLPKGPPPLSEAKTPELVAPPFVTERLLHATLTPVDIESEPVSVETD